LYTKPQTMHAYTQMLATRHTEGHNTHLFTFTPL